MENILVQRGNTYLKENGKTKYRWTVANVQEFKQLDRTIFSPDIKVTKDNGLVETFKMQLEIGQPDTQTVKHTLFLSKDRPYGLTVRTAVNESREGKTLEISGYDRKEIWKHSYATYQISNKNELTFDLELTILEIKHQ